MPDTISNEDNLAEAAEMTYVKVDPCSTRLGNWMFQYAAAKCAAPGNPVAFVIAGGQSIEAVRKYAALWPEAEYVRAAPEGASVRIGLFQDWKRLEPDIVSRLFKCPAEVETRIEAKYGRAVADWDDVVSVHVRRGAYLSLPHRHPFVGVKYLERAVAMFAARGGGRRMRFLVCSDDIAWCRRFFSRKEFKGHDFIFSEGNDVMTDLFLMAKCRGGHICSNSSFSFWGAYLGSLDSPPGAQLTVFPSMWFGMAIKDQDGSGMYFPGSQVIENSYSLPQRLSALLHMAKTAAGNVLRRVGGR